MLIKRIITLWVKRPKNWKHQWKLELGAYFIQKGTPYHPGQKFRFKDKKNKWHTKEIQNLFYNFRLNTVTHSFKK